MAPQVAGHAVGEMSLMAVRDGGRVLRLAARAQHLLHLGGADVGRAARDREAPHGVLKLAHVAGPSKAANAVKRSGAEDPPSQAVAVGPGQEVLGQKGDIVHPLPQRWHWHDHGAEAVEQVLPESPLLDGAIKAGLAGRHHARLAGVAVEHIQHPGKPGLRLGGQISHLVEDDGAAPRPRDQRRRAVDAVEHRRRGDHERQAAPVAEIMDRPRHEALARAALAGDEDGKVRVHDACDQRIEILHDCRASHQWQVVLGAGRRGGGLGIGGARGMECTRGALHEIRQIEGLGQVVEGLRLVRLDRRHDGVLGRDHDHRQARPGGLDRGYHLDPVSVGHHDVRHDEVALSLLHPTHQRRQGRGRVDPASRPRERLRQDGADRAVVVGDEYGAVHFSSSLPSRPAD